MEARQRWLLVPFAATHMFETNYLPNLTMFCGRCVMTLLAVVLCL